jgi:hypothetical protein
LAGATVAGETLLPADLPSWLQVAAWPAFVSWSLYFAKGSGDLDAVFKTMTGNTFGAVMAFLAVSLFEVIPVKGPVSALVLGAIILVAAFVMTFGGNFGFSSYVPAVFCGCACAFGFGVGNDGWRLIALLLSLWAGAWLGHASNAWGNAIHRAGTASKA